MNKKYEGGCYCGQYRYAVEGEIETSVLCHCGNCRRAIGAQAVTWILIKKDVFKVLQGELHRYETPTGAWRGFCPQCGTSVTYENPKRMDEIDLTTATLDDPNAFPPTWDAFKEERLTWVDLAQEK